MAVGRDATWEKLLGPVKIPLSESVQVHAAGGPISVRVAGIEQVLQTTELSLSESAHCTRLRSCCCDVPFPGQLDEVKSSSVQPARLCLREIRYMRGSNEHPHQGGLNRAVPAFEQYLGRYSYARGVQKRVNLLTKSLYLRIDYQHCDAHVDEVSMADVHSQFALKQTLYSRQKSPS